MSADRPSVKLMVTVMCAALYAVGSYVTAYIPSPWGFGQFRPAVVVPAFFAVVFGPIPAGVGAALGTLLADSVKHGYLYPGSLIAAVPGNFAGFYLMGWFLWRRFSWNRFIIISNLGLLAANLIVAVLYVFAYKVLYQNQYVGIPVEALAAVAAGLTLFWFVTMLPFVLLVTPPLIKAAVSAFPSLPHPDLIEALRKKIPGRELGASMVGPGAVLLLIALSVSFTGLGAWMVGNPTFGATTKSIIEVLCYVCGAVLSALGLYFLAGKAGGEKNEH